MSFKTLKRGDLGDDVVFLQSQLNKVGAMLDPDGDFGPGTEKGVSYAQDVARQPSTGVADPALWEWLEVQPEPYELLHTNGIAFIAREETGGLAYYDARARWPHYPGHDSGVTIGVGYDLRFNSEDGFRRTWSGHLSPAALDELSKDIGRKGSKSRTNELKDAGIEIPFKSAWPVFVELTLPEYYEETEGIYPSLGKLPDLCRSVLVSLVFNRGSKLVGSKKTEMREIQRVLGLAEDEGLGKEEVRQVLRGIEDQILSMKRLWAPKSGLIKRRQAEANLWREGLMSW